MHKGKSFKKVMRRHGKAVAHKMAVAAGLNAARGGRRHGRRKK